MKRETLLEALETAAAAMSVRVSYEAMSAAVGHGGLCRVKSEMRVIIDRRATTSERLATLAESLSRLDTADIEMPAEAREVVDYYSVRRAS
jgi:hypothetical protein